MHFEFEIKKQSVPDAWWRCKLWGNAVKTGVIIGVGKIFINLGLDICECE